MGYFSRLPPIAGIALLSACGGGDSSGGVGNMQGGNAPVTSTVSGAGVTVSVYHLNTNTAVTAQTDASGNYAVSGLPTGANSDYALYVQQPALVSILR